MKSVATITAALMLAAASTVSAAAYFSVDFEGNAVGDNYTSVNGVGTNTNLVGALPNGITGANASGTWNATVEPGVTGKRLSLTGSSGGSYFQVFDSHGTPAVAETWFIQFDYTRVTSSDGNLAVNFLNNDGANMFSHGNTATLYKDDFEGSPMAVDITHTLRLEIDSGTTIGRGYVDGVKFKDFVTHDTSGFGGIRFGMIQGATDFKIDNISGGVVPEPVSLSVLGLAAGSLLMARKRK